MLHPRFLRIHLSSTAKKQECYLYNWTKLCSLLFRGETQHPRTNPFPPPLLSSVIHPVLLQCSWQHRAPTTPHLSVRSSYIITHPEQLNLSYQLKKLHNSQVLNVGSLQNSHNTTPKVIGAAPTSGWLWMSHSLKARAVLSSRSTSPSF